MLVSKKGKQSFGEGGEKKAAQGAWQAVVFSCILVAVIDGYFWFFFPFLWFGGERNPNQGTENFNFLLIYDLKVCLTTQFRARIKWAQSHATTFSL